jgi:hypothetical protein
MSCVGGLNQFLSPAVPVNNGDGAALDVSGLVAKKTIYLSGEFAGSYVILGTHDDVRYVPIAAFQGGQGPQTIRRDIDATIKSLKVRRNADRTVVINVAAQATCAC